MCQKRGLDPPSHHHNFVCVCAPSQQAFVVVTRCPLRIGKSCDVRGSDGLFRDMCFTDLGSIVSSVAPCTSRSLWLTRSFRTNGCFSRRCRLCVKATLRQETSTVLTTDGACCLDLPRQACSRMLSAVWTCWCTALKGILCRVCSP